MNAIPLSVPFKGNRTYIHSTDVYPAVLAALEEHSGLPANELQKVDFVFRHICHQQIQMAPELPEDETAVATFSFTHKNLPAKWFVFERDEAIANRRECPEDSIIETSTVNLETQSIKAPFAANPKGTLIETIVALNKALHEKAFPDAKGKWLFTQIQTNSALPGITPEEIEIEIVRRFGLRLTKSEIRFDGQPGGHIFFSLLES